ncbi:MAG: bifunctional 4'-phosphopantothenoylcysteine decarboxylase/phosphopantothenoylcysteine synthetase, partial [Phycisphaerae bacterium]|nr:bifunctional 4'-phosphopantothenoylcysteine decarboxylase/phosphopantothenoylcysteine synthetase [Phycisphaerae bacterium]
VSKLVQRGASVTVVMSADAQRFVSPLTFQSLSGRPVRTGTYDLVDSSDPQHIALTERADLMVIAPATANVIGKIPNGICDDLIPLMVIAAACPVVFAPAMNNRMWEHPAVKNNIARLREMGYDFVGPTDGWLACRNVGPGRMSEPGDIVEFIEQKFAAETKQSQRV